MNAKKVVTNCNALSRLYQKQFEGTAHLIVPSGLKVLQTLCRDYTSSYFLNAFELAYPCFASNALSRLYFLLLDCTIPSSQGWGCFKRFVAIIFLITSARKKIGFTTVFERSCEKPSLPVNIIRNNGVVKSTNDRIAGLQLTREVLQMLNSG